MNEIVSQGCGSDGCGSDDHDCGIGDCGCVIGGCGCGIADYGCGSGSLSVMASFVFDGVGVMIVLESGEVKRIVIGTCTRSYHKTNSFSTLNIAHCGK